MGPVYAWFLACVRRIDAEKKAALARLITERVIATAPGEKLDEKLADLTFKDARRDRNAECEQSRYVSHLFRRCLTRGSTSSKFGRIGLVGPSRTS
jgi:hypothetical protein